MQYTYMFYFTWISLHTIFAGELVNLQFSNLQFSNLQFVFFYSNDLFTKYVIFPIFVFLYVIFKTKCMTFKKGVYFCSIKYILFIIKCEVVCWIRISPVHLWKIILNCKSLLVVLTCIVSTLQSLTEGSIVWEVHNVLLSSKLLFNLKSLWFFQSCSDCLFLYFSSEHCMGWSAEFWKVRILRCWRFVTYQDSYRAHLVLEGWVDKHLLCLSCSFGSMSWLGKGWEDHRLTRTLLESKSLECIKWWARNMWNLW